MLLYADEDFPYPTVGNIGLYYVCYQLSRLGWNVMPTARNAKGVDIVIYSQDGLRRRTTQVKSLFKPNPARYEQQTGPPIRELDRCLSECNTSIAAMTTASCSQYLSLMNRMGVRAERFGDATAPRAGL